MHSEVAPCGRAPHPRDHAVEVRSDEGVDGFERRFDARGPLSILGRPAGRKQRLKPPDFAPARCRFPPVKTRFSSLQGPFSTDEQPGTLFVFGRQAFALGRSLSESSPKKFMRRASEAADKLRDPGVSR